MEKDRKQKERQISELKNEVKILTEKVETVNRSLDRHEQYSRRNCLFIHGVKENEKEDTDEVVIEISEKEIEEKVSVNDIDRSHQLGKKIPGVHLGLLSSNLPGIMSVMKVLEKRRSSKAKLLK